MRGGLPETGDARFLRAGIGITGAGAQCARGKRREKKQRRDAARSRAISSERSRVSNHLGRCLSVPVPGFFSFFFFSRPSLRRSLPLGSALLPLPLPSRGIRARVGSLNYLIRRRAREIRAPKLMDRRRGITHNGRTNRDSTTALTADGQFSRYFCCAYRGEGARSRPRSKALI